MLGMYLKYLRVIDTWRTNSQIVIRALLIISEMSYTYPYQAKKTSTLSTVISTSTLWMVTLVFLVHMYSVCKRPDFDIKNASGQMRDFLLSKEKDVPQVVWSSGQYLWPNL